MRGPGWTRPYVLSCLRALCLFPGSHLSCQVRTFLLLAGLKRDCSLARVLSPSLSTSPRQGLHAEPSSRALLPGNNRCIVPPPKLACFSLSFFDKASLTSNPGYLLRHQMRSQDVVP